MGCGAAGACHVIQDGSQHGRHLAFYQKLEITKTRQKLKNFDVIHVNYDIIKHCGAFWVHFALFLPKKVKNTQFLPKYGLATCCL